MRRKLLSFFRRDDRVIAAAAAIAARLQNRIPERDLYDIGLPALHFAEKAWDGRGNFDSFAIQRIQWYILDELRRTRRLDVAMAAAAAELAAEQYGTSSSSPRGARRHGDDPEKSIEDMIDAGAANFALELLAADNVEEDVERMKLLRAVEELPPPEDKVVHGYYYEGKTFAELSRELNIGETTAFDAHARGLERLKQRLQRPPRPLLLRLTTAQE
ncbi:MAG: sigma-70 family RNA polymerase sigma factor [Polyangiaceae bacterium]